MLRLEESNNDLSDRLQVANCLNLRLSLTNRCRARQAHPWKKMRGIVMMKIEKGSFLLNQIHFPNFSFNILTLDLEAKANMILENLATSLIL
jgi:hypothetical protein